MQIVLHQWPKMTLNFFNILLRCVWIDVPEFLNVHINEHKKKSTFFRRIFFPSSEKLTFEKENVILFNTFLNLDLFNLIVVIFLWISFIWTFRTSRTLWIVKNSWAADKIISYHVHDHMHHSKILSNRRLNPQVLWYHTTYISAMNDNQTIDLIIIKQSRCVARRIV